MLDRWGRLGSLVAGVLFVVLLAVGFVLSGNTPNSDSSGLKVISYYHSHNGRLTAAAYLITLSLFFGLFFFGSLRGYLRQSAVAERLAAVALAGGVLFAAAGALAAGSLFALADVPAKLTSGAAQALNVIQSDLATGALLAGLGVVYMASGLAIERSRLLPRWLGWVSIVLGVVALTPIGWLTLFALAVWTLIVSALIYRRSNGAADAPSPAPAA